MFEVVLSWVSSIDANGQSAIGAKGRNAGCSAHLSKGKCWEGRTYFGMTHLKRTHLGRTHLEDELNGGGFWSGKRLGAGRGWAGGQVKEGKLRALRI